MNSENYLSVIDKLPHSKTRVPYTYHHDYLRSNTSFFNGKSRAEVTEKSKCDDDALYAVALVQVLKEISETAFLYITSVDLPIIVKAIHLAQERVNYYNDNF